MAKAAAAGGGGAAPGATAIDAALLSTLSEPDLARLLTILEPLPSQQVAARVNELAQAVMTAAAAGDVERTLQQVAQLAAADPLRAEAARTEPGLAALRAEVDALLARLTNVARLDAESRIAHAAEAAEGSRLKALPEWDAHPEALLTIANRLLEAGGYVNAVRAAQVAQVVVDGAHWGPAAGAVAEPPAAADARESEAAGVSAGDPILSAFRRNWTRVRDRAPGRLAVLWRRAPLLVLLAAWLAVGTMGGLASRVQQKLWPEAWPSWLSDAGFTVWSLGFLALVLFGFYVRVRNARL